MAGGPEGGETSAGIHRHHWRRLAGVFVLGGLLLGLYLWVVGVGEIQRAISHVPPRRSASLVVVGSLPLVLWGGGLHLVLSRFGIDEQLPTSVFLFSATGFLNSITPFGQAGGDPVSAVLLKRTLGTDFETALAAIGSLNALNRLASLVLGLIGIGYLGTNVAFGGRLESAAVALVIVTGGVLGGALVAWHYRGPLIRWSAGVLAYLLTPLDRLPSVTPPTRDDLVERGERFVGALERLVDAPTTVVTVFVAGLAGHLAVAATLWVALAALGADPPLVIVLLVIPVAKLSGAAPTPGGFGSAEVVLTALLVTAIGLEAATAGAAALLYRASAFWLPAMVGGLATAWYGLKEPATSPTHSPTDGQIPTDSESVGASLRRAEKRSRLVVVTLVISAALAVLVAVCVHSEQLLIEPDSLLVHTTRDAGLIVLSFGLTWLTLRHVVLRWVD